MSNFTPKLEGTIDDVIAINEQANSDYKAKYEAIIDKTSPVLVKYSGIKLWQLCNSTFKTREVFAKYNQVIQDKLADDYLGRVDTHGTEIAINQHNDIELQAQLWNALYENAVAEHKALKELYLELYEEDFTKRVMPQRTGQKVNNNSAMTPENIKWAKTKAKETAMKFLNKQDKKLDKFLEKTF
tara:strand:+ start:633 stop:1187 length:555 start_codon:yes stop_codon:yes gene_type:complete